LKAHEIGREAAFGTSLALSGDLLIVGASNGGPNNSGVACTFRRKGGEWIPQQTLQAQPSEDRSGFGWSVSAWGNRAIVGAPNASDCDATYLVRKRGVAYVFEEVDGHWQQQRCLQREPEHNTQDLFGFGVGVFGDFVMVTAVWEPSLDPTTPADQSVPGAGAAFVGKMEEVPLQAAYLKAPAPSWAGFGYYSAYAPGAIAIGPRGVLAIGAPYEFDPPRYTLPAETDPVGGGAVYLFPVGE
jgi:hypothetical protein